MSTTKTAIKLQWARFFTLAGLDWSIHPRTGFDFKVNLPCDNRECDGGHMLLVRVSSKVGTALQEKHDSCFSYSYNSPHPALFGDGPENTTWNMTHGNGGGSYTLDYFQNFAGKSVTRLWELAAHD